MNKQTVIVSALLIVILLSLGIGMHIKEGYVDMIPLLYYSRRLPQVLVSLYLSTFIQNIVFVSSHCIDEISFQLIND